MLHVAQRRQHRVFTWLMKVDVQISHSDATTEMDLV